MRRLISIAAAFAVVLSTLSAWSQTKEARMRTEGMICSQCVYGLGKVLEKEHGVNDIGYDAETQIVSLTFQDETKPVDWAQLRLDTYANGFVPKELWLILVGKVIQRDRKFLFEVAHTNPTERIDLHPSESLTKLLQDERAGETVEVTGQLIAQGEESFELSFGHKLLGKGPKKPEVTYQFKIESFKF